MNEENEDLIRDKIKAIIDSSDQEAILDIYDGGPIPDQHELSQVCTRLAKLFDELREAIS